MQSHPVWVRGLKFFILGNYLDESFGRTPYGVRGWKRMSHSMNRSETCCPLFCMKRIPKGIFTIRVENERKRGIIRIYQSGQVF